MMMVDLHCQLFMSLMSHRMTDLEHVGEEGVSSFRFALAGRPWCVLRAVDRGIRMYEVNHARLLIG